jgi:hypothetical protein
VPVVKDLMHDGVLGCVTAPKKKVVPRGVNRGEYLAALGVPTPHEVDQTSYQFEFIRPITIEILLMISRFGQRAISMPHVFAWVLFVPLLLLQLSLVRMDQYVVVWAGCIAMVLDVELRELCDVLA